jgi:hypothetical protein
MHERVPHPQPHVAHLDSQISSSSSNGKLGPSSSTCRSPPLGQARKDPADRQGSVERAFPNLGGSEGRFDIRTSEIHKYQGFNQLQIWVLASS